MHRDISYCLDIYEILYTKNVSSKMVVYEWNLLHIKPRICYMLVVIVE